MKDRFYQSDKNWYDLRRLDQDRWVIIH
jgi:hypothetical protein